MKQLIHIVVLAAFMLNALGPLSAVDAQEVALPNHKQIMHLSNKFTPVEIKGLKVFTDNPFQFDFILEKGDSKLTDKQLKDESTQLIRYFLASITVPEKDLWVNLSPYEKDRIVPEAFGATDMGRDLLTQDYLLKQLTSSLLYPEDEIGEKFWSRMKELAMQKFGTSNIPTNTFNKVWVVPEKAVVYENAIAGTAYIVESHLKVMLEEDYLALSKNASVNTPNSETIETGSQIIREIIIPELTKEINENGHFAKLRQIYSSYILATWYKQKIKNSILNQIYADKNKIRGINIDDPQEKQLIYERYLEAFKKGAYNYIKEEYDPVSQEMIPRKYFSGGFSMASSPITYIDIMPAVAMSLAVMSVRVNLVPSPEPNKGAFRELIPVAEDNNYQFAHPDGLAVPAHIDTTKKQEPEANDIALTITELGLDPDQARELIGVFFAQSKTFSIRLDQNIIVSVSSYKMQKDGKTLPGITISYQTKKTDGTLSKPIGRLRITRKNNKTLLLSGLFSRDLSQPGEEVLIIAPFINYDYDLSETVTGFANFMLTIRKKFGIKQFKDLMNIDLSDDRYKEIIDKLFGEGTHDSVMDETLTSRQSFNEVLSQSLSGKNYAQVSVVLKVLARAAVGLTRKQIKNTQIKNPLDLVEILTAFESQERKYSPSQKFPPLQMITDSLNHNAKYMQRQALAWGMDLELEVAMPDGLQNLVFYKFLGFRLKNPSAYVQKLLKDFQDQRKKQKEQALEIANDPSVKKGGKLGLSVIESAWELLKMNNFRHELATMVFGPNIHEGMPVDVATERSPRPFTEEVILDDKGNNIAEILRTMSELHRARIEQALGEKIDISIMPIASTINGKISHGASVTFRADMKDVWRWRINWEGDSLWISGLFIRDLKKPDEFVPMIANFTNYDYNYLETVTGFTAFAALLGNQLGETAYKGLLDINDLGKVEYRDALIDLFGEEEYTITERISRETGRTFTEVFNERRGGERYKKVDVVLKILAKASVGLTKAQIQALPIRGMTELSEVIKVLRSQPRKYLPAQQYPSDPIFQDIFKTNADQLKDILYLLGYRQIKMKVAIPSGTTNLITYKRMGYVPDNLETNDFIGAQLQKFERKRMERNPDGTKKGLQQISWEMYWEAFERHELLTVAFDLEAYQAAQLAKIAVSSSNQEDLKASSTVGGINFDPEQLLFVTQNSNGEIKFAVDPFILQELENVPGFLPVIMDMHPVQNLQIFLGQAPPLK